METKNISKDIGWLTPCDGVKHYFTKKNARPLCGRMKRETSYFQEAYSNSDWLQRAQECVKCRELIEGNDKIIEVDFFDTSDPECGRRSY